MMFGLSVWSDPACTYLLGSDESFDCKIAVNIIPWMKSLEKTVSQFR